MKRESRRARAMRSRILAAALLTIVAAGPSVAVAKRQATSSSDVMVAMNFLGALGHLDFDAAASLLDEDAVLDLPYARDGVTIRGKAAVLQFFTQTTGKSVSGITYTLDKAYPSPRAGATVLEISTQGQTAAGKDYTNRLVAIFVIRNREILLFREYFNAAKLG